MVTQKEFLADIDVALGGRVAEELIFGPENVTSGASSDLRRATATATHMVKASQSPPTFNTSSKNDALSRSQNWGYSEKIGPVYLNDREESISTSKREEIENEERRCVRTVLLKFSVIPLMMACFMQTTPSRPGQGLCSSPVEAARTAPCMFPLYIFTTLRSTR